MKSASLFFLAFVIIINVTAQEKKVQQGSYEKYVNTFLEKILDSSKKFDEKKDEDETKFLADLSKVNGPKSIADFKYYWHNNPKEYSQGNTGMCWDFAATSFYESEVFRLHGKKLKLSELYTAYWEYVEKARRFVKLHGDSFFGQGSESNAVPRIWEKYGIVPHKVYTGLLNGREFHDHKKMYNEMKSYLESLKENNNWNETTSIETIKSILNYYIGTPPEKFEYEGKEYTPHSFLDEVINLNFDDYIEFQSTTKQPFYNKGEFEVPDNWWHSDDYYNIPLDEFINAVNHSIQNSYTVCIGGDVSEPGVNGYYEYAVIPEFDLQAEAINQMSREYRISNKTTADDHGIHLVGYTDIDGDKWYLIKDSGSSSRIGPNVGYYFYREDFVKLKMLSFTVHKNAVPTLIKKLKE